MEQREELEQYEKLINKWQAIKKQEEEWYYETYKAMGLQRQPCIPISINGLFGLLQAFHRNLRNEIIEEVEKWKKI